MNPRELIFKWRTGLAAWLTVFSFLAVFTAFSQVPVPPAASANTNLIVHLYYGDRTRLDELVSRYDVFESADHQAGYVDALLSPAEYAELVQAGYRVEIDKEQTEVANRALVMAAGQTKGIPSFPCYRTVEETYATLTQITNNYPGLASLLDVGDSWEKITPGGAAGYDLLALVLSNKSKPGPKPRILLVAEYHARELVTAETAMRFVEELVSTYGTNPDVTWMLDYFEVHVIPMANPDGRKRAEAGALWRKNTDSDDGCSNSDLGTDMNRNHSFKWGLPGSSGSACAETYRGPSAFSEPETQAIRDYIRSLFPDQRGPNDTDPAPPTATGLVVSLHSAGRLVLYSWGWTTTPPPNATALQTLGGKFGYFNRHTVEPTIDLYAVSGELNDWAYGELGVATYTIEMGTTFFETCTSFETNIYPTNRPALYYACKACRQPYLTPAGPDVLQVVASPASVQPGTPVNLSAVGISGRLAGFAPLPVAANISAARYTVDNPSWWSTSVVTHAMSALDASFNSTNETVVATINTSGWQPGKHLVFVEARTGTTTWGLPTAVFINVLPQPPTLTAVMQSNQLALSWRSFPGLLYTLQQATSPAAPFSVLASNILGAPPTNTFLEPIGPMAERFYRVLIQP